VVRPGALLGRAPLFTLAVGLLLGAGVLSAPAAHADDAPVAVTAASNVATVSPDTFADVLLSGLVTDAGGVGVPYVQIEVLTATAGAPVPADVGESVTTGADGTYVLDLPAPTVTTTYTVVHPGGDGYATASAAPVVVGALVRIEDLGDSGSRIAPGNNYWTLEGAVDSIYGGTVVGEVRTGSTWTVVNHATIPKNRPGYEFSLVFRGRLSGKQQVRARYQPDAYFVGGVTATRTVSYAWGPVAGSKKSYATEAPFHFSHCSAVTWALNPAGAPPGALGLVKEAFNEIAHYSGYHFRYLGLTAEKPSTADSMKRMLHGTGPQILLKWVKPRHETDLTDGEGELGVGGDFWWNGSGGAHFGGAFAVLENVPSEPRSVDFGPEGWGTLVLHELGHALGLAHTGATDEIMFPSPSVTQYGAGDIAGLQRLGHAKGCGIG
jgi:hypothetical protein